MARYPRVAIVWEGPVEPGRFVADVDTPFMHKVLHISQGKWKPDVHRHSKADDLRRRFEVTEWAGFFRGGTLPPARPALSRFNLTAPPRELAFEGG